MKYQDLLNFLENVGADPSRLIFEDELTGLYNRRFLLSYLENKVSWEFPGSQPMSLLMMDVDHFKQINDTHGHQVGDQALIWVSKLIKELSAEDGLPVRYAGDEFMILLPGAGKERAVELGEQLIVKAREHPTPLDELKSDLSITLSIGAASAPDDALDGQDLIQKADMALYSAKRAGRNQVADAGKDADPEISASATLNRGRGAGRESQLNRVERAFQEFTRGASRLFIIEGAQGMGKSEFLKTLSRKLAGSRIRQIEVRGVLQENFRPYYLATSILVGILNQRADKGREVLDDLTEKELNYLSYVLPQLGERQETFQGGDPATQRSEVFATLVRVIPKLADSGPLLVLVDDLHLADEATLLVLRGIALRQEIPVFLCGTSAPVQWRGVEGTQNPLQKFYLAYHEELNGDKITLTPWTADEIAGHLEAIFPQASLPEGLTEDLAELTQGNPLFINEILRKLVHDRKITLKNQNWVIEPLERDYLPKSLEEIVSQQIARLDEEDRELLNQASVFGERVSLSMLAGSSELEESKIREFIDQAVSQGLISSEYEMNDETIRFLSKKVLSLTYGAIPETQKQGLHERVGSYQETLYAQKLLPSAATLAYHFNLSANREKAGHYRELIQAEEEALFDSEEATGYTEGTVSAVHPSIKLRLLNPLEQEKLSHVSEVIRSLANAVHEIQADSTGRAGVGAANQLKECIDRIVDDDRHIHITCADRSIVVNGEPVDTVEYRAEAEDFVELMRRFQIRSITFSSGLSARDLQSMLEALSRTADGNADRKLRQQFAIGMNPVGIEFRQERRRRPRLGLETVFGAKENVLSQDVEKRTGYEDAEKGTEGAPAADVAERGERDPVDAPREEPAGDTPGPHFSPEEVQLAAEFLESSADQLSDQFFQGDVEQSKRVVDQLFRNYAHQIPRIRMKVVDICDELLSRVDLASQSSLADLLAAPLLRVLMDEKDSRLLDKIGQVLSRTATDLIRVLRPDRAIEILTRLRSRQEQLEREKGPDSKPSRIIFLKEPDPGVKDVILSELKSGEPTRVQEAVQLLALSGSVAVPFLIEIIKREHDSGLQQAACRLIKELGQEGIQQIRREIVLETSAEQRAGILNVIDSITRDLEHELAYALEDPSLEVRRAACSLVERLNDESLTALLVKCAKQADSRAAVQAIESLTRIRPKGAAGLFAFLLRTSEGDERLIACCRALGRMGDSAAIEPLSRMVSSGRFLWFRRQRPLVRAIAALALAQIRHPRVIDFFADYQKDRDPRIRRVARNILNPVLEPAEPSPSESGDGSGASQ